MGAIIVDVQEWLQERADHETGHFLVANELDIGRVHWLTLEPREGTGGSCGIELSNDIPHLHRVMYQLGGLLGETIGRVERRQGLLNEIIDDVLRSGGDDLVGLIESDSEHISASLNLVKLHWVRYQCISKALVTRTTLYGNESEITLLANDDETGAMDSLLTLYLLRRQHASPPQEWLVGANARWAAGPWFEDYETWWRRDGRRAIAEQG